MEGQEITLQEMLDGFLELTPSEACLLVDIQDMFRRKYDTMYNDGYTEEVMGEFDTIAERYELNKTHRTRDPRTRVHLVGGGEATLH